MRCTKCRRPAIIFQRYSGLHLCREHFLAGFEAKAKRTVRVHGWIAPGDTVAIAVSGGKGSAALLSFLHALLSRRGDVTLAAVTVDEGIASCRGPGIARGIARDLGVPCLTVSFNEHFGTTLDEIVRAKGETLACSYCGVLRRHLLDAATKELGATRLALGSSADDGAQSVLVGVMRGDCAGLLRGARPAGLVPRITPFMHIPEREVALYAFLRVRGFSLDRCPYSRNSLREDVRRLLSGYAWRHPNAPFALVNLGDSLSGPGNNYGEETACCRWCGEPGGAICRSCRILAEVGHAP